MRESLCSIPISEVLEKKRGCPICTMHRILEERMVEYITGAAMMEPDVRCETNRKGFCHTHFEEMLKKRNRLSVALILESHLKEVRQQIFKKAKRPFVKGDAKKQATEANRMVTDCFVCDKIEWAMERQIATLCRLYGEQSEVRALFAEQEGLCLPHYARLTAQSDKVSKRYHDEFLADCKALALQTLDTLEEDVSHFCKMFDYRNSGENADIKNAKDSLERAVLFLTGQVVG